MAQENYLSGSAFGQVAGSLLQRNKKRDKKERNKALLATVLFESLGALQKNQKQGIVDGVNAVNKKYNDIFKLNEADFASAEGDRKLLKRYIDSEETFLNEEVKKIINNTDEVSAARVTWDDVDKQPKELRDSMYAAYNEERKKLMNKMEALKVDPRATTQNFERFNKAAKEEYLAALKLVENDPTKKGLLKAAWNRIFKSKSDPTRAKELREAGIDVKGDLVTNNTELFDLQDSLIKAKNNRTTFRDSIDNQIAQEQLYTPLVFKNKEINRDAMYSVGIKKLNELTNGDEIYANVDSEYFKELLDQTAEENPNFTEAQIIDRAYTLTLTKEVDPAPYLTRQGAKLANGRILVDEWRGLKTEKERRQFFDNDPTKLYQLGDALKLEGFATEAAGLLTDYKDIYEQTKAYQPTTQEVTRYVQKFRNTLDPKNKQDKQIIADSDYLGIVGGNAALAANYFTANNKNWSDNYTETEIEDAALGFVLGQVEGKTSTNTRMVEADLLRNRINLDSKTFDRALLEDTPRIIQELKEAKRSGEIKDVRNLYHGIINQNKNLNLDLDEKAALKLEIDTIFKDAGETINVEKEALTATNQETTEIKPSGGSSAFAQDLRSMDQAIKNFTTSNKESNKVSKENTKKAEDFRKLIAQTRTDSGPQDSGIVNYLFEPTDARATRQSKAGVWNVIQEKYGLTEKDLSTPYAARNLALENPDIALEISNLINTYSTEPQEQVTNGLTFAESSNDPDALWKQSQKETFKNFTPTQSTLKEVLEFTKFDGEYADWSRQQGQNKTTHTPVGKYQFVGATLRDIKNRKGFDDLNINDNTIFTEQVQDKLFEWYIKDTIKSVGTNATQEDKREKIRARFEGATTEKVSNKELDLIIEQILADSYSSNINQG